MAFNNAYYQYANNLDQIGELIKSQSHAVSPGGAQKLTAQALGLLIQVMNQNLRAQATDLKIKAETLALENKKDKDATKSLLDASHALSSTLQSEPVPFTIPRY